MAERDLTLRAGARAEGLGLRCGSTVPVSNRVNWLALNTRVMVLFAVSWVVLQIFGYVGALEMAKGDFAHPLFKSQVMLHVIALALLVAAFIRAFK